MDLKETDILGAEISHHWYYTSKAKAMTRMLEGLTPKTILDVGAGSAFFSRYLLANSEAKEVWCVDISYENESENSEAGKSLYFRRAVDGVDADLVLLMDVLEHVEDDVELLKEYAKKVPCGSRFLITVPAFQFLWSAHDDFLEHKRRYTLDQIESTVRNAGLVVNHASYYFAAVFPIAATLRVVSKTLNRPQSKGSQLKKHSAIVNSILKRMCCAELPLMKFNRFAGLTAFCIAQKPNSESSAR